VRIVFYEEETFVAPLVAAAAASINFTGMVFTRGNLSRGGNILAPLVAAAMWPI